MRRLSLFGLVASVMALGAFAACSGTVAHSGFENGADAGGSGGGDGSSNPQEDSGDLFGDASNGDSNLTCAATTATAHKAAVDIIFVIDDSGSMTSEMTQIKTNVNTFATKIGQSGLDYKVIFVVRKGTSGNTICVPPPLGGAGCADNPPTFYHVNQDVQSDDALSRALATYDSAWKNYVRFDAYKVFVIVSDDNAGNYGDPVKAAQFDPQLLAKAPAGMFGTKASRKYIVDSIVGWSTGTAFITGPKCNSAVNNGSEYQQLSQLTGGIIDSVCLTDYSAVLDNLAKGLTTKLGCEFALPKPEAGTFDPTKVVVQFTPSGGTPQTLTQVTDPSKCGAVANAWYFDDNVSPTKILLCPSTCTTVGADQTGSVEVLLGCKGPAPR